MIKNDIDRPLYTDIDTPLYSIEDDDTPLYSLDDEAASRADAIEDSVDEDDEDEEEDDEEELDEEEDIAVDRKPARPVPRESCLRLCSLPSRDGRALSAPVLLPRSLPLVVFIR